MEIIDTIDAIYYCSKDEEYDIYLKNSDEIMERRYAKLKNALAINGLRLAEIKSENQTLELLNIAIEQNILSYQYSLLPQDDTLAEKIIRKKYYMIEHVKNQKEYLCMIAISIDPRAIIYIRYPTSKMIYTAIKNGARLRDIPRKEWCEKIYKLCLETSGYDYQYIPIEDRTLELARLALVTNYVSITLMPEFHNDELFFFAFLRDFGAVLYFPNEFIKKNLFRLIQKDIRVLTLSYLEIPNEILEKVAEQMPRELIKMRDNIPEYITCNILKKNGLLLEFISFEKQTDEMILFAVQQNGLALKYAKKQTRKIIFYAIKQNKLADMFVYIF